MTRLIVLCLFFLLTFTSNILSQGNYSDGYVVVSEADSIHGKLAVPLGSRSFEKCVLIIDDQKHEYLPDEILGYGYQESNKYFSSQIVEGSFVEVLVSGEMSLFLSKDVFLIKKGDAIHELDPKPVEVIKDGKTVNKKEWVGVLSYLVSDCQDHSGKDFSKMRLDERKLTELVVNYNTCRGNEFTVYKSNDSWAKLELGLTSGVNYSQLRFKNADQRIGNLASSYTSIDPYFGVSFFLTNPRLTKGIGVGLDVLYFRSKYEELYPKNANQNQKTLIDLKTISLPLYLKLNVPIKERSDFSFLFGFNVDWRIEPSAFLRWRSVVDDSIQESDIFEPEKIQMGIWSGLSYEYSFNACSVELMVRYYFVPNLASQVIITNHEKRFSTGIIIKRKK